MSHTVLDPGDSVLDPGEDLVTLKYIVSHVFCPLQLPDGDDHTVPHNHSLAGAIASVARLHSDHITNADMPQWHSILRMLDNLQAIVQFEGLGRSQTISQLSSMVVRGKPSSPRSILETHNVQMSSHFLFKPKMRWSYSESRKMSPFSRPSRHPRRPRM